MSCALATLATCFTWSSLYVDTGLLYRDRLDVEFTDRIKIAGVVNQIPVHALVTERETVPNPYGRFAIGYSVDISSVSVGLEASHVSSIRAGDRGINSLELRARWYPFRR